MDLEGLSGCSGNMQLFFLLLFFLCFTIRLDLTKNNQRKALLFPNFLWDQFHVINTQSACQ